MQLPELQIRLAFEFLDEVAVPVVRRRLGVCRKTISQHQFSTATTDFFLFSVDRWLYLPAEGSISALFREFVS
ncbi:MAG: hypothetical protein NTV57_15540, partial [Cyanobacteria bacterium]|nr:hypothetical protein [Cyanobacteriota bacterium]